MAARNAFSTIKLTKTLVEQVAEVILQMAMQGEFEPGSRIQEPEIARRLNISRVPVREALRILEADGIVTSTPYKGMRFMEIGEKQIRDIRQMRLQLEIFGARLCIEKLTNIDHLTDELRLHLARMSDAEKNGNLIQMTLEDLDFHRTICRQSGNKTLLRFFDSVAKQLCIIFSVIHRDPHYTSLYDDHMKLIAAFELKDAQVVERALSDHILTAAEYILGINISSKGGAGTKALVS